ncbi:MAG: N-acetylmuramoyl-L-alanine amidase, partial [Candidatus Iainarchaeum archaeon]
MFYEFIKSPNFWKGRRGFKPEAIVIHITEGTASSTIDWFTRIESQVSSHYLIDRSGKVYQFVKEEDTAWHAGKVVQASWKLLKQGVNPNFYTIGIELEGFDDQ